MPSAAGNVCSCLAGLIYLGISEGFVLTFIPSPAAEHANSGLEVMLKIDSKTILNGRAKWMVGDLRNRSIAGEEIVNRIAVHAHVGVIHVAEQTDAVGRASGMQFQFKVFSPAA